MNIVEKIRNLCVLQNTSIKALERELNFSNGSIKNWDISSPSIERIQKVAEKFNVSIDWLITGKDALDLTLEERKLIKLYQNTNEAGQLLILKHAEDIQKTLPQTNLSISSPKGSLTSMSG